MILIYVNKYLNLGIVFIVINVEKVVKMAVQKQVETKWIKIVQKFQLVESWIKFTSNNWKTIFLHEFLQIIYTSFCTKNFAILQIGKSNYTQFPHTTTKTTTNLYIEKN